MDTLEKRVLMAATVTPITTTVVDPSDGLRLSVNDEKASVVLGDWATDGNSDSWVSTGASSTVIAGGAITETSSASGTPITISRTGITAGPQTVEYGFYDYVQVRMQLPASYNGGDVTLNYGTSITVPTSQAGVTTAARSFTIPAAQLATDGAFHTYRINVGKAVFWEGNLVGLRVSVPATAAGQDVTLDYVEVGDLPNTTLAISPTTQHVNNPAGYLEYPTTANGGEYNITPGSSTFSSVQSKHYIYYYDTTANPGGVNLQTAAHNTLEQLEQSLRIYTQVLGFKDAFSWAGGIHSGETTRFKLNVTTWYRGYFSGGFYFNVDTSGSNNTTSNGFTVSEAPGSPIPHEYGHVTDTQNGAYLAGGHWESHANWYREQWANWYGPKFASVGLAQSTFTGAGNRYSNLHIDNARLIYNDFRIYTPLQYYATSLGMDPNAAAKLWSAGSTNQTIIDKLASLVPSGSNIKDVVGTLMQYWPTLDFPVGAIMKAAAFPTATALADFNFQSMSYLEPEADNPGWFKVSAEKAPEKYGYATHVLTPTAGSTSISLTFNGLPSTDTTADWRWSLQAVGADGVTRYSPLYGNGATGTLAILPTDTKVMLVVTATPGNTTLNLDAKHNTKQDTQDPARLIYPYEVTMTGAAPATGAALRIAYARGNGAFRTNPDGSAGGWVDSTATVASTAYVAAGAQVLGTAKVQGAARVLDFATIAGNATVSGNAIISGYAVVNGTSAVSGNARVRDFATVTTNAIVNGNAVIEQYATLNNDLGQSTVTGNAVVRGVAQMQGGTVSGTAILDYDYTFNWSLSDGTHAGNYPYDADWVNYYENSQVKPRGLLASYRVNETAGQYLFDEFGTLNSQVRGTPTRVNDTTLNSNVLSLNGTNQYAVLDRSLAALTDGTYAMWVSPTSAAADQPLLYFGSSANSYLKLVARDANGFAHLTISVNGTVQQLVSTAAVPLNAWTHLAITFTGGVATFYVNGKASGSGSVTFRPTDVLANGTYATAESLYLGRDAAGGLFAGKLDDVRFYNVALTPAEVASEVKRVGTVLGTAYATTPKDFDGSTTTAESGVHSGFVRTFSAWIKPDTSPSVTNVRNGGTFYTPIVDSTDERNATGLGNGLGINNGKFAVRLDNSTTIWDTGIAVSLGQWQKVTLTLSGTVANLYVNGVLRATRTYTSGTVNGKNYRIGYGQTTVDSTSRRYFDGQIYDLTIADRVVIPAEMTLPAGWSNGDIGSPGAAGSTTFANNTWVVIGAGAGVTSTSDNFQFASTGALAGDGQIDAKVAPPVGFGGVAAGTTASSGLMIRNGTGATAVNAMVSVTTSGNVAFQYRSSTGGVTTTLGTISGVAGPVYLRLIRSGNSVSAFYSTDGTTYTQVGTSVALTFTTPRVGLALSSKVSGTLAEGVFTNVAVTSASGPTIVNAATATSVGPASFALSVLGADPDVTGEADLSYRWSLVGTSAVPVIFTANGTNAAKNTVATFLSAGTYAFVVSAFDSTGQAAYSTAVNVTVAASLTSISPTSTSLIGGTTQQFSAFDQFGQLLPAGTVTWSTTVGSITAAGLFTAPGTGSTATITAAYAGSANQTATVTIVGPLAWYKNDNITTSGVLADSSGNGKNGTITTPFGSTTGEIGQALNLAGGTATLPNGLVSSLTNFTISGWVKIGTAQNWSRLFDFGTGTTSYMFLAPADGAGKPRFSISTGGNGAEQTITSAAAIPTGVWTFMAVTLSGTNATLYVNGVVVGTNNAMTLTPSSLGNTTRNYIGKSQFGDPNLLGSVDDLRIYGAAAPADTITAMYQAGVAAAASIPGTVTATAVSGYRVNVGWVDNAAAETGYLLERATDPAFTVGLTTFNLAANTTTYADTAVSPNVTYYYRVTALLAGGLIAGPVVSVPVTTPANAAPTILTVSSSVDAPTTATGTTLTALASDDAGEPALVYTWSVVGTPPGTVTFGSTNGTNAGKNTTAAFTVAGTYTFQIAVRDALNLTTTTTTTIVVAVPAVAPTVSSFIIDDGSAQRSIIQSLTISFSSVVHLGPNAIVLSGVDGSMLPISYTLSPQADSSTYVLTFTDANFVAGSLADGRYQLKVNAAAVTDLTSGLAMATDSTYLFHRFYGDYNGDGSVSLADFSVLALSYGSVASSPEFNRAFDFNGDGGIGLNDFTAFAIRFGTII